MKKSVLPLLCGTVLLSSPVAVLAQGATAPAASDAGTDEIVVTAQKRVERLLDVPMSVSTQTGQQLADAGIRNTADLNQVTPGLTGVNNGFAFTPAIRGISSIGTSSGDENNVAIYLDDIYVGTALAGLFEMKDIERVEVLKGPQGTLFGRNATGGAIRVVTKAPSFTPEANASVDYGFEFHEVSAGLYASTPISDKVAVSFSGSLRKGKGYTKGIGPVNTGRTYSKPDNYLARGKMLFKPTDSFQVTLSADVFQNNDDSAFVTFPILGYNGYAVQTPAIPITTPIVNAPFRYAGDVQPMLRTRGENASADMSLDATDTITVRSISAYRTVRGVFATDNDRTPLPYGGLRLAQNVKTFSQEFNFSGKSTAIDWLVGLYYYNSDAGNPYFTSFGGNGTALFVGASFGDKVKTESYAAFADATWNITDQLHLTGGARYTTEKKDYHYYDLVRAAGLPLRDVRNDHRWNSTTYRAVARYDFTTNANIYASYSNGFKSGVYNAYSFTGVPVSPEKIKALEIGAKARVAGLTFTAAAYDYKYSNIQVQSNALFGGTFVVQLQNAARAKIRGAEFAVEGTIVPGLTGSFGGNYMPTAKYVNFTTAQVFKPDPTNPARSVSVVPYDASGSRLIRAPRYTVNARLTYKTDLAGGKLMVTASDSLTDAFNWQAGGFTRTPSYNVVNARVAWTEPSDHFTFSVWATNLTDQFYSRYSTTSLLGDATSPAQPRQIGVGIAARF